MFMTDTQNKENDYFDTVIKCPYCGQETTIGELISISGMYGCPSCYWEPCGLRETVLYFKENDYETYRCGSFYKNGYEKNKKFLEERK